MDVHKIAIVGGTGDLGRGLVARWADAGFSVVIGSRTADKAAEVAQMLTAEKSGRAITGADNISAAAQGDVVVVSVPFSHQKATLESIKPSVSGKIVVDTTVCLAPPKVGTVQLPDEGSAGLIAEATLGDVARVVAAFQNVPAAALQSGGPVSCDVLVTGNDKEARLQVVDLIKAIGVRGFSAGPMANSVAAEALTSVLITINRQYKVHAGIQLTDIPDEPPA